MTKEVTIKIKGIQLGMEEEFLTLTAPGIYHLTNGKHYIQYDEKLEDNPAVLRNTLKISSSSVLLIRKAGQQNQHSRMLFELNETTQTTYPTPYGSLPLDIKTKSIRLAEASDNIEVILEYSLYSDDSPLSDNVLSILIEAVQ